MAWAEDCLKGDARRQAEWISLLAYGPQKQHGPQCAPCWDRNAAIKAEWRWASSPHRYYPLHISFHIILHT